MERLFIDTSGWFAYANRKAPAHEPVRKTMREFPGRIVTSNFILDETLSLCRYRLGHAAAVQVGSVLSDSDSVDLVRVTIADEHAAWDLFRARPDQTYSFTDCTSFVLMRRLGLDAALALDADFRTEGFRVVP